MIEYIRLIQSVGITKGSVATIIVLSILAAFFDTIGLALIYYGISAFTQTSPSTLLTIDLNLESIDLRTILALLIIIYVFRYIILTYHAYKKSQFIFDVETRSGQEIINRFLRQNLLHKKTNEKINYLNAITKESVQLQAYTISVINLIAELCQALAICLLFLLLTPIHYQLVVAAIGIFAYGYIHFSGKMLSLIATRRLANERIRSKTAQEIIMLFKEIQIYDQTKEYLEKYIFFDANRAKNESISFFIQSLPKIIFEAVISFIILTLLALQLFDFVSLDNSIPILTVLMMILFKMAPAVMRISTSINSLKYNFQSVKEIHLIIERLTHQGDPYQTIALLDQDSAPKNPATKILISNLSFSYPQSFKPIFQSFNKTLFAGNIYAVKGENGVGKSTLLDLIFGLINPDEGSISFFDRHGEKVPRDRINIGYLPQNPSLFQKTLESNITLDRTFRKTHFDNVLQSTNISALFDTPGIDLTDQLNTEDRRFSRGQIQRIAFARSNYLEPTILLLDEPFAAVDDLSKRRMMENLKSCRNRIIVIVSHDNETLNNADEILNFPR